MSLSSSVVAGPKIEPVVGKKLGQIPTYKLSGHYLSECPKKQRCPACANGFVKWMEVEKKSSDDNLNGAYDVGESSGVASGSPTAKDKIKELSRIFKIFAQISER
ncbi:Uncharacterized protein Fot_38379 [Forsythia ovata]|uniref:Uncharacterized protein n=1 Tax=Forsythia ovata TaxID=205694 RepID=A0ABD1S1P9_9LAMI